MEERKDFYGKQDLTWNMCIPFSVPIECLRFHYILKLEKRSRRLKRNPRELGGVTIISHIYIS